MRFTATVYLNVTTHAEAHQRGTAGQLGFSPAHADSLAIFLRGTGRDSHTCPGDRLVEVDTFTFDAPAARTVAEMVYAMGNGAGPESESYYAHRVRSFCAGDVVVVHTPDGPLPLACESNGWTDVALDDFELVWA